MPGRCTRSYIIVDTAGVPSPQVHDPVPGHQRAPQQLGVVRVQAPPGRVGVAAAGVAVHASVPAGVVLPDVDAPHAPASLTDRDGLRLVRDVQGAHHLPVDTSPGLYAEPGEVPGVAAAGERDSVLLRGPGGHLREGVHLRRRRPADHALLLQSEQLAVDVHEAEHAAVGPHGGLAAHHVELPAVVLHRYPGVEDHGIVPPHHPVPADPAGDLLAGVAYVGLERDPGLDVPAVGGQRDVEKGHVTENEVDRYREYDYIVRNTSKERLLKEAAKIIHSEEMEGEVI